MNGKIKRVFQVFCGTVFLTAAAVSLPQRTETVQAAEVTVDSTNFPDEVFREYVSAEFDKDGNGILSDEEIAEATEINVDSRGISD